MRLDKEMGVGESEWGERKGERRRGGERGVVMPPPLTGENPLNIPAVTGSYRSG